MSLPRENSLLERLDLTVEQLDYAFVGGCGHATTLEKILKVLRSGEEGVYPHLIEYDDGGLFVVARFVEQHLAKLKPDSRLLLRLQPATRVHDLPRGELAALEADLAAWTADLKLGDEKRSRGREEKEAEEEEEEGGRKSPLPPILTHSDLPPLDDVGGSDRLPNRIKKGQKSRDPLSVVTRGKKSPGSLIKDITEGQNGHRKPQYGPLNKVIGVKRPPGSLIEVIEDQEGQGLSSGLTEPRTKFLTVSQEGHEPSTIIHKSAGSVIKITSWNQQNQGAASRQEEALLREAERQEAEGDLLSASLSYNKVLSVCPQHAKARRALASLLLREEPPAKPPPTAATTADSPPITASVPLVQEIE